MRVTALSLTGEYEDIGILVRRQQRRYVLDRLRRRLPRGGRVPPPPIAVTTTGGVGRVSRGGRRRSDYRRGGRD